MRRHHDRRSPNGSIVTPLPCLSVTQTDTHSGTQTDGQHDDSPIIGLLVSFFSSLLYGEIISCFCAFFLSVSVGRSITLTQPCQALYALALSCVNVAVNCRYPFAPGGPCAWTVDSPSFGMGGKCQDFSHQVPREKRRFAIGLCRNLHGKGGARWPSRPVGRDMAGNPETPRAG